jgi:RNA polymerase sigma-70 factor (ECF subfamily)
MRLLVPQAVSRTPLEPAVSSPRRGDRLELVRESREERAACDAVSSEGALVQRLRRGESAAYETLVRAYGPRLLAVARGYLHSQEDAEDVVQSAFLLVSRFVHHFEGESPLSTWLHRIVVNGALMRLRSRSRHAEARRNGSASEFDGVAELEVHVRSSVVEELEQRKTRDRMLAAVGRLPDRVRAAVRLRDVDGLSLAEASLLLGRSLAAVKTSVHRGRLALRSMLACRGEPQRSR